MSMFRAKNLDIGSFVNIRVIRDHSKRKAFAEAETQRYEGDGPVLQWNELSLEFA